jgi:uncharacterized protein (TIGR03435 family)
MRCLPALAFVALIPSGAAFAQPSFEVASIKPAVLPPPGRGGFIVRGGPGSSDPSLATFANIDLFSLVAMAYGVKRHELSGPEWLKTMRFDISARVPRETTPEQYRMMLQELLAERFKLTVHREKKELQVYELVVAKNGLKLKKSALDSEAAVLGLQPPPPMSSPPLGFQGPVNVVLTEASMERLANVLSGLLGEPVTDGTGLHGNYDIKLRALIAGHPAPEGSAANADPELFEALPEQLGLRLVRAKRLIDILVVDRMERMPTEN